MKHRLRLWRRLAADEAFVGGNRIQLLRNGKEAFPEMLSAIANARRQVLLEMYWFDSDQIGRRFAKALCDAVARGVEVAVVYDALGSITANAAMFAEMAEAGVKVVEFNPIAPYKRRFKLSRLTRRDHRKILVVDAEIGFTGGLNIADAWLPFEEGGKNWRDDVVRIVGPVVMGLMGCFFRSWRKARGPKLTVYSDAKRTEGTDEPQGSQAVRVLGEHFFRNRHEISRAYVRRIDEARRKVWIANSYFVPDSRVLSALIRAARRGVDVRVLLPDKSDVAVAQYASRAVWDRIMRQGIRIYEWTGSMLHSKTAVIDGKWSTIGSFNLDYVSLRFNYEVNVSVYDPIFANTVEHSFELDLAQCREVSREVFARRPWYVRLVEAVCYRFRKVL